MATPIEVNLAKFSAMLRTKRGDRGLRAVAEEIGGVSASTLSRIEQRNVPDLDTFMRICRWLGVAPDEFMAQSREREKNAGASDNQADMPQFIEANLRADRVLPPETINALTEMIRVAYRAAKDGALGSGKGG